MTNGKFDIRPVAHKTQVQTDIWCVLQLIILRKRLHLAMMMQKAHDAHIRHGIAELQEVKQEGTCTC